MFPSILSKVSVRSLTPSGIEPSKVVWRFENGTIPEEAANFEKILRKSGGFEVLNYNTKNPLPNITKSLIGVSINPNQYFKLKITFF